MIEQHDCPFFRVAPNLLKRLVRDSGFRILTIIELAFECEAPIQLISKPTKASSCHETAVRFLELLHDFRKIGRFTACHDLPQIPVDCFFLPVADFDQPFRERLRVIYREKNIFGIFVCPSSGSFRFAPVERVVAKALRLILRVPAGGGCGGRNISSLGIMTGDGSGVVRQNDSLKASITCCMSQTGSGSTHFVTTP